MIAVAAQNIAVKTMLAKKNLQAAREHGVSLIAVSPVMLRHERDAGIRMPD
jgi:hypothetical protein